MKKWKNPPTFKNVGKLAVRVQPGQRLQYVKSSDGKGFDFVLLG